jgi:carbonic anhydrase/acetyltransferase-like protein (isoleucine patch superfamily)
MIRAFIGRTPRIHPSAFIAESADVIGDVSIGADSSVWFNATLRGDVNRITIGDRSNIQDNAVIHVTHGTAPTRVGDEVTVGHGAVLHGCTVEDGVLVGIRSTILDHAVVGSQSIVGAGALVTGGTRIPPRSMVLGVPARVVRPLSDEEVASLAEYSTNYVRYKNIYIGTDVPDENPFYSREDD